MSLNLAQWMSYEEMNTQGLRLKSFVKVTTNFTMVSDLKKCSSENGVTYTPYSGYTIKILH